MAAADDFERMVADAFRRLSWRVRHPRPGDGPQPDLIVEGGGRKYVVEIKRSSEGRRDRVIPLLSQAILEAQASARLFPEAVVPVAVVGA
ncbi:MAG: restriction endonuclease, partial [Bryobacterales bacterium]|nr:restriction endonuclease [Bryobacterales bacterium]